MFFIKNRSTCMQVSLFKILDVFLKFSLHVLQGGFSILNILYLSKLSFGILATYLVSAHQKLPVLLEDHLIFFALNSPFFEIKP
ncbi:MAG: hypothetical protein CMP67_06280 [Flavobacteriales bacterium]|nr:hypothetical protein [Flavobacteriales bacterium]